MAYVVLVLVVVSFFAVGFAVGVLIVAGVRHWRQGRNHRDSDHKLGRDRN